MMVEEGVAICHGSPLDEDTYVFSDLDAYEIFSAHDVPVTFFGHTHIPSLFSLEGREIGVRALRGRSGRLELDPRGRYLVNPGSIGQPRDRDPRASYMTYDSERRIVNWRRLPYPVDRAQGRIRKAGLPPMLADRLAVGV
jgi:diadenosine tetraphosphatase ApaH/serine/threonine PP2A family protein phosphatase